MCAAVMHHMWLTWCIALGFPSFFQWSSFNGHVARKCTLVVMAEVVSCNVHGVGCGIALSTCSMAPRLLPANTTFGLHVVLPLVVVFFSMVILQFTYRP